MKSRTKKLLRDLGLWCLGKAEYEFHDDLIRAIALEERVAVLEHRQGVLRHRFRELLSSARNADSLLSTGEAEVAQRILRVAVLNSGGPI